MCGPDTAAYVVSFATTIAVRYAASLSAARHTAAVRHARLARARFSARRHLLSVRAPVRRRNVVGAQRAPINACRHVEAPMRRHLHLETPVSSPAPRQCWRGAQQSAARRSRARTACPCCALHSHTCTAASQVCAQRRTAHCGSFEAHGAAAHTNPSTREKLSCTTTAQCTIIKSL